MKGERATVFTPNDSDDLAAKLSRVFPARDEREAMGKTSREMVQSHGIERTLQTFEDIYRGRATTTSSSRPSAC